MSHSLDFQVRGFNGCNDSDHSSCHTALISKYVVSMVAMVTMVAMILIILHDTQPELPSMHASSHEDGKESWRKRCSASVDTM